MRRGVAVGFNSLPIVKLFDAPFDKISNKILFVCNFLIKFSYTFLLLL